MRCSRWRIETAVAWFTLAQPTRGAAVAAAAAVAVAAPAAGADAESDATTEPHPDTAANSSPVPQDPEEPNAPAQRALIHHAGLTYPPRHTFHRISARISEHARRNGGPGSEHARRNGGPDRDEHNARD